MAFDKIAALAVEGVPNLKDRLRAFGFSSETSPWPHSSPEMGGAVLRVSFLGFNRKETGKQACGFYLRQTRNSCMSSRPELAFGGLGPGCDRHFAMSGVSFDRLNRGFLSLSVYNVAPFPLNRFLFFSLSVSSRMIKWSCASMRSSLHGDWAATLG